MKVLIVTSGKSGPFKSAHALIKYLTDRKDQVYIYLLDAPEYDIEFKNVILDKPFASMETLGYYGRLVRLGMLKKVKFFPNVILTCFALPIPFIKTFFPSVPIVYKMMGVPRLAFSEGILKLAYAIETSIAKRYAKEVPTITTTEYYRRLILKEWKTNVYCIHDGVDTTFYKPPRNKNEVKSDLRLMHYDYIVTLGLTRFNDVYKPITYIKWYLDAICQHKEKKILSLILGKTNTEQHQNLQGIIDKYLIEEQATNHSFRIEYIRDQYLVMKYYQISDLLISFAPQSLMEKEALACGVPVITEFWEGENAIKQFKKFQHKSVKTKFIKIFDSLIENGKTRNTFSKNARIVAEKDFSYVTMGMKYRRILNLAISESTYA
jgi:glycosyltransferase involved in cell wall biosynthesis